MPVGNILDVSTGCIIHQVNAQGVMGSGVAWALRERYPQIWTDYSSIIKPHPTFAESSARLGQVIITEATPTLDVASIVGQQFYGKPVPSDRRRYTSYDAVDVAFIRLAEHYRGTHMVFHYPLLGSDRGGAWWPVVREIINFRLEGFEHHLWVLSETAFPVSK